MKLILDTDMPLYPQISAYAKQIRQEQGLTLRQSAAISGASMVSIYRLEQPDRYASRCDTVTIDRILSAYRR